MIELARVVDRGIRESHMIDVSQLVIKENKSVVGVFADNVVVDYDGNLFDACSFAATAALLSTRSPKWEFQGRRAPRSWRAPRRIFRSVRYPYQSLWGG